VRHKTNEKDYFQGLDYHFHRLSKFDDGHFAKYRSYDRAIPSSSGSRVVNYSSFPHFLPFRVPFLERAKGMAVSIAA